MTPLPFPRRLSSSTSPATSSRPPPPGPPIADKATFVDSQSLVKHRQVLTTASSPIIAAPCRVGEDETPPSWDPVATPRVGRHREGQEVTMMTAIISPRLNLLQGAAQKKLSPKGRVAKKSGTSPKGGKGRSSWNACYEKDLVDLLHEHNTPEHRGQNGWSSETWNKIVKKFHEKHPYVTYTKQQTQKKEKELKKEYRMLKEVRKQSDVSWDDQRCMIQADPPLWENIIILHSKVGKFKTKAFPLDALGELYDGQTAEGTYNFTSIESSQNPTQTQLEFDPEIASVEVVFRQNEETPAERMQDAEVGEDLGGARMQMDGDAEVYVQENTVMEHQQTQPRMASTPSRNRQEKEPKRQRGNGDVAEMMVRYMEIRAKQVEDEKAKPRTVDEFSIKNCITLLNTMDITPEEEVKAFRVFKISENREIFLSARPKSALNWLRSEME